MKKTTRALAAIFLAALSACNGSPVLGTAHAGESWDPDVEEGKVLLAQTVKVELSHVVDVTLTLGEQQQFSPGEEMGGSGSGFVAEVRDGSSLVVTASHVCDDWETKQFTIESLFGDINVDLKTVSHSLEVVTINGEHMKAKVLEDDKEHDACVISVDGVAGTPAEVAETTPGAGARLVHTGAPLGVWDVNAGAVVDGRSMGIVDIGGRWGEVMGMMLASEAGSSGGPVFYRGRVVGILVAGNGEMGGNMSFAVQAEYIKADIDKARVPWRRANTRRSRS